MLITKADIKDKAEIYGMWKKYFAFDDAGYTDYYFINDYKAEENYVLKIDDEVISCLQVKEHQMVVGTDVIDYVFIAGVATKEKYRRQGYMSKLLIGVCKQLDNKLILIQGYNPKIYYPFGFETVYRQKTVIVKPKVTDDKDYTFFNEFNAKEMLKLYQQFTKSYDGYKMRDLKYYLRKAELNKTMNWQSLTLYYQDTAVAYIIYYIEKGKVTIEELIYSDKKAAKIIVGYIDSKYSEIKVKLMENEDCLDDIVVAKVGDFETLIRAKEPAVLMTINELIGSGKELYFNEYE